MTQLLHVLRGSPRDERSGRPVTGEPQPRWQALVKVSKLSLRPAAIAVLSRVGVLLVAGAVSQVAKQPLRVSLVDWDSKWYVAAAAGYPHHLLPGRGNSAQSQLGFFPMLPLLIRLVHIVLTTDYARSGLLVTFATSITAAVAVWWMLRDTEGPDGASRGTAMVLFSPGAFTMSMVYSEGLLITVMAGCFMALRRKRWVTAGALAAVASATDPLGTMAIVPCAVVAWKAIRRDGESRSLAAPLLAPVGVLGFFAFLWAWVGTPFAWFIAQRRGWQGGVPGASIPGVFSWLYDHGFSDINDTVKAFSAITVAVLLVFLIRSRPETILLAYVVAVLAFSAASPVIGWTPRVALRAFPLLAVLGARAPKSWFGPIVGVSGLVMAALAVVSWGNGIIPFTP